LTSPVEKGDGPKAVLEQDRDCCKLFGGWFVRSTVSA